MEIDFWAARWKEGRIGFHEGRPNSFLEKYVARLGQGRRVLVPLCGKSEDLAFLAAQGHQVVGIEVVEDAVKAFFAEHGLEPQVTDRGRVRAYSAGVVTILAGDLFACTKEDVGAVDALYDRAALVALSPEVRPRYVAHLRALLEGSSSGLLVSFEYAETPKFTAPPYSVGEDEVRRLYAGAGVDKIDAGPSEGARAREAGVVVTESCFAIALP